MKRFLLFAALAVSLNLLMAQQPIGTWQVHFSYNAVNQIAQTPQKVYALSEGSLYSVDKYDQTIEFYSKLSGLNGTNIVNISYDDATQTLLIAYKNGLIDLLREGGVECISDLYQKQLNTTKGVNGVFFYDKKAYLATDFGIMLLNLQKNEVQSTYYVGDNASEVKLLSVAIVGEYIYATDGSKIYYANVVKDNLVDYSQWKRLSLPTSAEAKALVNFNDKLCALIGSKIYEYADASWTERFAEREVTGISVANGFLFGYTELNVCVIKSDFSFTELPVFYGSKQAFYDNSADLWWLATGPYGLANYSDKTKKHETFLPNGPASNTSFRLKYDNGRIISVPGGRWSDREKRPAYLMIYENGEWTNTDYSELVNFAGQPVYDFMNVAVDPADKNHLFVTSYGCGMYEYRDMHPVFRYTSDNSGLSAPATNPDYYTRTDGAVFDQYKNLWVLTTGSNGPNIHVMTPTGEWFSTNITNNGQRVVYYTPQEIMIDSKRPNYKWIPSGRNEPGLGLLDDNGTPTDFSDDRTIFRTSLHDQNNNDIPIELLYACTQDTHGNIWLGTLTGPLCIPYGSDFFRSDACERVIINRTDGSGLADYLLNGERINAIAIDGAGRKWMGTQNSGAYLLSDDCTETIYHFTTDNSPLASNTVQSIVVNPQTGEVFIGTAAGLVSFQGDATEGDTSYKDVYAFPNPVRPDFSGVVSIVGLKADSKIVITNVAGHAVHTTTSNGGMATWDCTDGYGRRVPTGVYLVQAVDADNKEHVLTKILVIN